jgi:hypothetical protein
MQLLPAALIERLPARLWRPGNLFIGKRLHFCYGDGAERTLEWQGREIGQGVASRLSEVLQ